MAKKKPEPDTPYETPTVSFGLKAVEGGWVPCVLFVRGNEVVKSQHIGKPTNKTHALARVISQFELHALSGALP